MSRIDPGTGLTMRAMLESDLDRIVALAASLPTAPQWSRSTYETALFIAHSPRRIALTAELGAEMIGFAIANIVGPQAEIETIAVASPAQRHGFGSSLLQGMLDELKLAGVEEVVLEVRPSNERALAFYRRADFNEVGRRKDYYRDPEEDALVMRLQLGA